uniref:Uncharacterized protein n=1 Tax=Psilocybe cubensis TaxID=181762 RepID=A0A8H7Y8C0_PSICU
MYIDRHNPLAYEDWKSVLRLSTLWKFDQIRDKAINWLSSAIIYKDWAERIKTAKEFNITIWLRDAYVDLVQKNTLSYEDLTSGEYSLEWDTVAKIFFIRAQVLSSGQGVKENMKSWKVARALVNEHLLNNS